MWTSPELSRTLSPPASWRARRLVAQLLITVSRALDLLATHLLTRPAPDPADPVVEFHGDAGAPEGALYVNGELVGHVLGVSRL